MAANTSKTNKSSPIVTPAENGDSTTFTRNALHYDTIPYTSHPFPLSQPTRIGAIAQLFGLNPPPIEKARVLEIGCASGGNLIPLAAQFPDARFTGIDISPVQVAAGKLRCENLKLKNIEIICGDIAAFDAAEGAFDYIICHGVFSWVEPSVRAAILAGIGKMLSRDGVADISYNVLPGWRMRQALRDAMILHAGNIDDAKHRVTRARWILNFLKERTATTSPWGQTFRNEAAMLSAFPDDYIAHEFLETTNDPITFTAFAEQAREHGLGYLGDADITTMIPENLDPQTAVMLREMCAGQVMPIEQYMDIVTGRTFRQSLLVRAESEPRISRSLDTQRIEALHLIANRDIRKEVQADNSTAYIDKAGRHLTTAHQAVVSALDKLTMRSPSSSLASDLMEPYATPETRAIVTDALTKMLQVGLLRLSTGPIVCGASDAEYPKASSIVRRDAGLGQVVVNAHHESVVLGLVAQIVLPALDGTRDRTALQTIVLKAVTDGKLTFQREGNAITTPEGLAREAESHVEIVLRELAYSGLLMA